VAEGLTGPFAIAALVVAIAGMAKLRAPATAAAALVTLGLPGARKLVRLAALAELALAGWCVASPGRWGAVALAAAYAGFTAVAALLARRRASCGCFGGDAVVSAIHMVLSPLLGLICAAAAVWTPTAVLAAGSVPLVLGVAGAAYAIVLAYTELPAAWSAWWA
jgi:hypothetical protein